MVDGINHITFSVGDIASAFVFYREVLGLVPVMRSPKSAYLMAGATWIALVEERDRSPSEGYGHVCFHVDESIFEEYVEGLRRRGIREWQPNRTEGKSLYFLDDSGNRLEIHSSSLKNRVLRGKAEWGDEVEWFV